MTEFDIGDRGGIQVIARAASIMRSLKDHPQGLSLGQIAERVSLPRSTVQRIVGALQSERLVMAANPEGGIRLGPELRALADAARIEIVELVRPVLVALSERTGETVDLAVLRARQMIFLDQVPGTQRLRTISSVGEAFPLTTTANGKACLALLPLLTAKALANAELRETAARRSLASLVKELVSIRKAGIALDLDEHSEGISAAGFAFRDLSGGYCAISVPTPSQRFEANRASILAQVAEAARQTAKLLAPLQAGEVV